MMILVVDVPRSPPTAMITILFSAVFSESFDRNVRDDAAFNMANMASFDHISHHPLHPNQKTAHAKIVVTRTNKKTFVTHSDIQLCVQTRVVYKSMLNLLTLLEEDFLTRNHN